MGSIEFRCPSCQQRLCADERHLRAEVSCQRCGRELRPIDAIDRDIPIPALLVGSEAGSAAADELSQDDGAAPSRLRPDPWPASAPRPVEPLSKMLDRLIPPGVEPPPEPLVDWLPREPPADGAAGLASEAVEPVAVLAPGAPAPMPPHEPMAARAARRLPTVVSPRRPGRQRTSLLELSQVAERTLFATKQRVPINVVMAVVATVVPQLVLAMVLTSGIARSVLGAITFVAVCALLVWGGLRLLPKLAKRYGTRELPGGIRLWLGGGAAAMVALATLLTWGMSKGAAPLAAAAGLRVPSVAVAPPAAASASAAPARTDQKLSRSGHLQVGPGVMHVPPTFDSPDGSFDLLLHFHGNPQLVEKGVAVAGLNAVVHVTNLGTASERYAEHFVVPGAFDDLIQRIERKLAKLGLDGAKARRVAVSSWSAGYGAVYRILQGKGASQRIDALLMLDGLHVGFYDDKAAAADPLMLEPYSKFAREAASGRKLFLVTHSEVKTPGYASSTETADLILGVVGAQRQPLDSERDSPPRIDFEEGIKAFPHDAQRWLRAKSAAHVGNFHVLGFAGNTPEDHMAHLIQMSVTALPPLVERWRSAPGDE